LMSCGSFSIAFRFEILWNLAFGKSIESNMHHIVVGIGPCALSKHIIRLELINKSTMAHSSIPCHICYMLGPNFGQWHEHCYSSHQSLPWPNQ
jgi:hypothetical protein